MAENRKTDNSIIFEAEDGTEVEFSVVEQTTLGGVNYLFVIDKADDESHLSVESPRNRSDQAVLGKYRLLSGIH